MEAFRWCSPNSHLKALQSHPRMPSSRTFPEGPELSCGLPLELSFMTEPTKQEDVNTVVCGKTSETESRVAFKISFLYGRIKRIDRVHRHVKD